MEPSLARIHLLWPLLAIIACLLLAISKPLAVGATTATAGTPECGNITSNTEWAAANSPHVLTCTVVVYPGVTLTVDPGVTVEANGTGQTQGNTQLWVKGTLVASGTTNSPIVFTSSGSPNWQGIFIDGSNSSASLTMDYATVQNAQFGISIGTILPITGHIRNSIIQNNVQEGILLNGAVTSFDVTSNTITNNRGAGIDFGGSFSVTGNNVISNPGHGMYVRDSAYGGPSSVQNNVVSGNGCIGMYVTANIPPSLSYNTITSNYQDGIYLSVSGPQGTLAAKDNNIYGNGRYAVEEGAESESAIDTTNSWWGTTDTAAIDAAIYDFSDNPSLGIVSYSPIATAPVAGAPADPGIPLPSSGGSACNGGLPTPTPTPSPTSTPTLTPSPTPTPTIHRVYLPYVARNSSP